MKSKGRVLVAMSGGVDSSVTAVMLKEQGYDVIGITMKTWDYSRVGGKSDKETGCCTLESMNDARQIAVKHGFKHFIVDIRDEFGDWVIDRFVDDYMGGRTPNPCVLCNTHIKWAALLRRADNLGCDYIATGHYANVREENGRYVISRGKDPRKDQSYALWGVAQKHLERTIFPLGSYEKTEIRNLAEEFGLTKVADKPDSYEICFIPDDDYHRFLRDRVDNLDDKIGPGKIIDQDGEVVGQHKGYPFYTVGQRRGLDIAMGYPVYVTDINAEANVITIGRKEDLISTTCRAGEMNLVKYDRIPEEGMEVTGAIRYNDDGAIGHLTQINDNEMEVHFPAGREAITPGQAVVCYEGNDVVAGGWIRKVNVESEALQHA
ncbi:tRNA 2-thiouridine(34) synthase MnmA [Aliifodinibius sp. S!AR15-10]|uniref:tRNA 2-thiouridine(34) synthase MnmA n=1 Tax=Aliifodinibius sp. S!AR15-10 TaxID=2950437 RepID=UPI002860A4CC|nr:tRNA 2-thiouridine(34) synthase MnmA [Aliifodinibius sp. S!AR15-10]MDR8392757.1 tRNA 2-thiouridine(34) synthase MnmA [Aliifodinibius sp. S!AR15-10]